ncbi:polyisoprenoid-binding protein [Kocuria sediminis]|uniref:Polyisoprenoid-binding protein n=1 Tax=Kocuria sediminis TaxID=1038857 RepID=A0A6N8GRF8_9MICC|nr:YceI family protein [Kocuria sediminis]MUN64762.1 polyisoprenoid-binding protein [Kocuria sediminis]
MAATQLQRLVPGSWTFDPAHSEVGFSVRHAGISKVRGTFREVDAHLRVADPVENSTVHATIQMVSIDTRNTDRDNHVRSADFFDVENHPTMTFTSTAVAFDGTEGTVTGELTIKGITKTVELETEFNGVVVDAFGVTRAGFSATTTISRKDFGITWNAAIEAGGVLVSDKVTITLDVAFTAPQDNPETTVEGQEALTEEG